MSYSQNNEEEVILDYFKDFKGRFLDIGAWDGKTFSNTLALAERGWSGVCVEPSPSSFNALVKTHENNPQVDCVSAAFAPSNGIVRFFDSNGDALSSTSQTHFDKWGKITSFKKFWVNTVTMKDIMNVFGASYDMINLDVESTNIELLKCLPLDELGVKLICVEHDSRLDEVRAYCKGFKELMWNGENIIMAR